MAKRDSYKFTARGVEIYTQSGPVRGSKQSAYIKWLMGWIDGRGWSGAATLRAAWAEAVDAGKPAGCSWYSYGLLMAREQRRGRELAVEELERDGMIIS